MKGIHAGGLAAAILGLLLIATSTPAAEELPKIPADKLKAGAQILLDMPIEGGHSSRLARDGGPIKPMQMYIILPRNYQADKPHPVIVHCGGGAGNILEIDGWSKCVSEKNFILIAVDYNGAVSPARDVKFKYALLGLDMLKRSTAVDTSSLFLTGFSSGAYGIADWAGIPEAKVFCGFVVICGGSGPMNAAELNGRPVLFVAGENDTAKASGGMSRVDAQKKMHENLLKAGGDSEILVQAGVGHEWNAASYPAVADWLYRKLPSPEYHRMKLYTRLAALTQLEWRKAFFKQKLAGYWMEIPGAPKG